jgi:putative transposase
MLSFIDENRKDLGVEPIGQQLPIAPSTYYAHKARLADSESLPKRIKRDLQLEIEIRRVYEANFRVYGARKVWRHLNKEGIQTARCTVERLIPNGHKWNGWVYRELDVVRSGKRHSATLHSSVRWIWSIGNLPPAGQISYGWRTRVPLVGITFVATWTGFVYVAFIIDVFARYIVGWRVSRSLQTDLVLDALEQALWSRKRRDKEELIHHSDQGSQYWSIRYSERLEEVDIRPSVGSVGDSYDNALAETINGLYKAEVIRHRGPWKQIEDVEYATLEWVDWFNNRRLLEPIGYVSPAEYEMHYYETNKESAIAAWLKQPGLRSFRGDSHWTQGID